MNKFIVICVVGCILYKAQSAFAITCYNCTSVSGNTDCLTNVSQSYILDCPKSTSSCYFAVADSSLQRIYEVKRGCGPFNQETPFDVEYDIVGLPLFLVETCETDYCNRKDLNLTLTPTSPQISCYNCSTVNQPLCRHQSNKFNISCSDITDKNKAYCHTVNFTYNGNIEYQYGCGYVNRDVSLTAVPNRFEAHLNDLTTCHTSFCNINVEKSSGVGQSGTGLLIFLSFLGLKYLSQYI